MDSLTEKKEKLDQIIQQFEKKNPKYKVLYKSWSGDGGISKETDINDINEDFLINNQKIKIIEDRYTQKAYKFSEKMDNIDEEIGKGLRHSVDSILGECINWMQKANNFITQKDYKNAYACVKGVSSYLQGEKDIIHYIDSCEWDRSFADLMEYISEVWIFLMHQEGQNIGFYNNNTKEIVKRELVLFQSDMNKWLKEYYEKNQRNPQIKIFNKGGLRPIPTSKKENEEEKKDKFNNGYSDNGFKRFYEVENNENENDKENGKKQQEKQTELLFQFEDSLEGKIMKMKHIKKVFKAKNPLYKVILGGQYNHTNQNDNNFGITQDTKIESINEQYLTQNKNIRIIEEKYYEKGEKCGSELREVEHSKGYKGLRNTMWGKVSIELIKVQKEYIGVEKDYKNAVAVVQGVSDYLDSENELYWHIDILAWSIIFCQVSEIWKQLLPLDGKSLGYYNEQTKQNIMQQLQGFQQRMDKKIDYIFGKDEDIRIQIFNENGEVLPAENPILIEKLQDENDDQVSISSKQLSQIKISENDNNSIEEERNEAQIAMDLKKFISRESSRKSDLKKKLSESRNSQCYKKQQLQQYKQIQK